MTIKVKRLYDPAVVTPILIKMWSTISDDTPLDEEAVSPPFSDMHRWYATYEDDKLVSVWFVHQLNLITWQLHIHFLPEYWGKGFSTPHAQKALKKIWTNTKAKKLYASVPEFAKPVLDLAKRTGFKQEGRMKKSYQKDGEIYDQIHIGVYR